MLISMLFVGIIVYGFIGLKKGGIKSIGGLISMILSFILSRCLAIPVTQYVCNESGISDKISSFIQSINGSVLLNGNAFNLGFVNLSDPANQMINSVNNVVNLSAEKLLSSFIMILLFSLFMFIFGLIIHLISSAVKIHPDLHRDDKDATAKFAKVSEAYRLILENREKKHKSIFNFGTIFSDAGSKTNTEKKKETTKSEKPEQKGIRGSDVYTTVEITFEESILGCRKEIPVQHEEICPCSKEENRTDNCTICNNTGKVLKKFIYEISIPRGIFSGQVLKIKGKGNVSESMVEKTVIW